MERELSGDMAAEGHGSRERERVVLERELLGDIAAGAKEVGGGKGLLETEVSGYIAAGAKESEGGNGLCWIKSFQGI